MSPRRSAAPSELPPGFALVRVIGHGASGRVVLARDLRLGREVAVKTVYGGTLDTAAVARLRREGRVLAGLAHPYIAKVFDLQTSGADVFVVMEYAAGGDLQLALHSRSLTGSATVRVLTQIAAALQHAGDRGIVHRDVKPSNILLTSDLQARLADFGLARLPRSSGAFRTADGTISGTPTYMAPEQIDGSAEENPAFDAFAFAAATYEALTGSPARRGVTFTERSPVAAPPPWLPAAVASAVLAGLHRDPRLRATPAEVAATLRSIPDERWDELLLAHLPPSPGGTASPADGTEAAPGGPRTRRPDQSRSPAQQADPGLRSVDADPPPRLATPAYRLPRRRRSRATMARLLGVVAGVVIGTVVALVFLH